MELSTTKKKKSKNHGSCIRNISPAKRYHLEQWKSRMDEVSIPKQPPHSTNEKQLADAYAVLYQIVNAPDPDTGVVTPQKVETQLYRDYLDNQAAYHNARLVYSEAHLEAMKTPIGRNRWPLVASTLQLPVKAAYDKWRSGGADKIEQALAIINTFPSNY
jgi:hypothetical protein